MQRRNCDYKGDQKEIETEKYFNAETVARHPKLCRPMQLLNFKD